MGNIREEDLPFLHDLETLLLLVLNFSIRKSLPMLTWKASWPFSLTIQQNVGFLGGASGKEPTCQCMRLKRHGFDPWFWKILWRRNGNPLQNSWGENPMDRGPWQATVHRVAQSWTWLKQLSTHTHIQQNMDWGAVNLKSWNSNCVFPALKKKLNHNG